MLNGLDLFSGIGGITRALSDYVLPIAYCEKDEYARAVLFSRMHSGELPIAPIWDDVNTLKATDLRDPVDIIYGGFPCQDISVAGLRKGLAGERSGLYWNIPRLAKETHAAWIFLENVPGIRTKGLLTVVRSLAGLGYDCRWTCVSAAEVNAPQIRKRWFLLAHAKSERLQRHGSIGIEKKNAKLSLSCWWSVESDVGRVAHGVPFRLDRIKGLGNAVVPAQAKEAFERLMGL